VEKRGGVIRWTGRILPNSEAQITKPRDISEPVLIFTCSLSDFWHEHVPFALRKRVVAIIEATPRHSYQVLTKRPELIAGHLARLRWTLPEHVWLGATVENRATLWRIDALRAIPSAIRFLLCGADRYRFHFYAVDLSRRKDQGIGYV
jgi:protein gp37